MWTKGKNLGKLKSINEESEWTFVPNVLLLRTLSMRGGFNSETLVFIYCR